MTVGDTYILDEKQGKSLNRIDTKTNWEAVNPVLAIGEMGIEKDGLLQNIKVGDGVTPWNNLQYMFKSCPYEVGDILVTMNATDPAVRWPGTTWEVFAPGRVLIGAGTGTDINGTSMEFKVGATGGEYSHQLTVGELPSHKHIQNINGNGSDGWKNSYGRAVSQPDNGQGNGLGGYSYDCTRYSWIYGAATYIYTNAEGSNSKHSIIQPYSIVHRYKRLT